MRITVIVKSNAKHARVAEAGERSYVVHVDAPAHDGKANARLIALLAARLEVSRSRVRIVRGVAGRRKIIEID